ncbi:unnamed protein product [Lactuca saligna]|uniref:Uncharacterized protein n=1 Tax=Lactuca saligna TaxID=75948 RepID=A0AA36ELT7_LACSI|nr:unnamed protein product [Lactuca saligna]
MMLFFKDRFQHLKTGQEPVGTGTGRTARPVRFLILAEAGSRFRSGSGRFRPVRFFCSCLRRPLFPSQHTPITCNLLPPYSPTPSIDAIADLRISGAILLYLRCQPPTPTTPLSHISFQGSIYAYELTSCKSVDCVNRKNVTLKERDLSCRSLSISISF